MHQRGIEERRIALFQRQLHVVLGEVFLKFGPGKSQISGRIGLRIGQVQCWPAFQWHIAMRDSPLQSQRGRQQMGMNRPFRGIFARHEAKVIIAMRILRSPARIDPVDLRGELVIRPQPGIADQREADITVILRKSGRIGDAVFLQRIPDPVIRARFGEMIPRPGAGLLFLVNHTSEQLGRPIQRRGVAKSAFDHDDAGTRQESAGPFAHQVLLGCVVHRTYGVSVIDQHVLVNLIRVGPVGCLGFRWSGGKIVVNAAGGFAEPGGLGEMMMRIVHGVAPCWSG